MFIWYLLNKTKPMPSIIIRTITFSVASRFVNDIITTGKVVTSLMRDAECSKRRADYAAKVIQQAFRSHLARRTFYDSKYF